MSMPSSNADVLETPSSWPDLKACSKARRSSGKYPERYAATRPGRLGSTSSSSLLVMDAMDSAPRRDLMNAMVLTREETRLARMSAVSATAVLRCLAPFSPLTSVKAGSQNATVVEP
ncbi:hypothetical protein D3C73_1353690 [compost metagenome]